ncbi:MAG TPA: ABC transporter substrate-binding protein [Xanthobacteraceae bacterium]|nr:ABC transporter substrate-binding protein [Xanthobacteraceae bacterium]
MQRRRFILSLAGTAVWPLAALAQAHPRYRVGMLDTSPRDRNGNFQAFAQVLRERGYIQGQNLAFVYRSADGYNERFPALAAELAGLGVDVIVTRGTPAALAAKAATMRIPVVMAAVGDPLAVVRGTENLTGFGANLEGAERKRVETLKEMVPQIESLAALMNLSNPSRQTEWNAVAAAASALGITARALDTRKIEDIETAFETASRARTGAVVVGSDTIMQSNQRLVVETAARHKLPAIYTFRDFVEAGGLVSCGVSLPDLYRRAADYVDRILKGASPQDLPVEPARGSELVVNRGAAAALGLTLPAGFLAHADVVIE